MAVLRQHLPSAPRCCPCAASLALAASCTLARVCTRLAHAWGGDRVVQDGQQGRRPQSVEKAV
jgi:hypothetical protein